MASPPDRPVLRARYDERRRRVIDAAAREIAARGYHETSVNDLVRATGLTSGGLYHYIGSKEHLLFAVFDDLMEPLLEQAEAIAASGDAGEAQLRALLRTWMAHVEAHRHHMVVFQQEWHFVAHQPQWEGVRDARKRFEAILGEVLERVRAEGRLRAHDPQLALLAVLGMVNYTPQWFDPAGRLTAAEIADGYCDLLVGPEGARPAHEPDARSTAG